MQTEVMRMLGIEAPIFAFSHCRDVVAAVSRAGGMGVLGTTHITAEELEVELRWLDENTDDRIYGVDLMFASNARPEFETMTIGDVDRLIPAAHRQFVDALMKKHNVPELPLDDRAAIFDAYMRGMVRTHKTAEGRMDVVFDHPKVKLMASALGVPPQHVTDRCHEHGIKVIGMVGHPKHVRRHVDAGMDIIVSAGYEAGGHTGDIATMVLTPQVVDAAAPIPVLHAGGIARGRQIAAALALGAQGVWTGTIWLGTSEAETTPLVKEKIFAATSSDTLCSKCGTGHPARRLRSAWVDAWEADTAPKPLPMPLQSILVNEALERMDRYQPRDLVSYPAGQGVGMMSQQTDVRAVFLELLTEFGETMERMGAISGDINAA
ncbi:MAG: nitronate monooxygenase [Rhodospirillaceae bacterium]|nr:nitronate monooxygenase [Rhodospirillaceae bacterium]